MTSGVDSDLDIRKQTILRAVVDSYIANPNPVASSAVAASSGLNVSAATIRGDMHVLEEAGYLVHTHTSSGRIPTEKGYRFFVDNFVEPNNRTSRAASMLTTDVGNVHEPVDILLEKIVHHLSQMTQHVALLVHNVDRQIEVCDVHVTRLPDDRQMVAVIYDDSSIQRIVVNIDDLDESSRALVHDKLGGALHSLLCEKDEHVQYPEALDDVVSHVMTIVSQHADDIYANSRIHVSGVAHLARDISTSDVEISAHMLTLVEQNMALVDVVRASVHESIGARIGSENIREEMSNNSMVLAPFSHDDGTSGAVGVIGPTRMDYVNVYKIIDAARAAAGSISE